MGRGRFLQNKIGIKICYGRIDILNLNQKKKVGLDEVIEELYQLENSMLSHKLTHTLILMKTAQSPGHKHTSFQGIHVMLLHLGSFLATVKHFLKYSFSIVRFVPSVI